MEKDKEGCLDYAIYGCGVGCCLMLIFLIFLLVLGFVTWYEFFSDLKSSSTEVAETEEEQAALYSDKWNDPYGRWRGDEAWEFCKSWIERDLTRRDYMTTSPLFRDVKFYTIEDRPAQTFLKFYFDADECSVCFQGGGEFYIKSCYSNTRCITFGKDLVNDVNITKSWKLLHEKDFEDLRGNDDKVNFIWKHQTVEFAMTLQLTETGWTVVHYLEEEPY